MAISPLEASNPVTVSLWQGDNYGRQAVLAALSRLCRASSPGSSLGPPFPNLPKGAQEIVHKKSQPSDSTGAEGTHILDSSS